MIAESAKWHYCDGDEHLRYRRGHLRSFVHQRRARGWRREQQEAALRLPPPSRTAATVSTVGAPESLGGTQTMEFSVIGGARPFEPCRLGPPGSPTNPF